MTHHSIPASHFSKKTLKRLASLNIFLVGMQACPDENGSYLNSHTGYLISDNETGRLLTYLEVIAI